jgi:hypothetical protein
MAPGCLIDHISWAGHAEFMQLEVAALLTASPAEADLTHTGARSDIRCFLHLHLRREHMQCWPCTAASCCVTLAADTCAGAGAGRASGENAAPHFVARAREK